MVKVQNMFKTLLGFKNKTLSNMAGNQKAARHIMLQGDGGDGGSDDDDDDAVNCCS